MLVTIQEAGVLVIRYIHFSSILWCGMMFFMVVIFPANRDGRYSLLFPRVQKFMKIVASITLVSGIVFLLANPRGTIEGLFGTGWGFMILARTIRSTVVYIYLMTPKG